MANDHDELLPQGGEQAPWQERPQGEDAGAAQRAKDAIFTSEQAVASDRANVARGDKEHMRLYGVDEAADRDHMRAEISEEPHTRSRNSPLGK